MPLNAPSDHPALLIVEDNLLNTMLLRSSLQAQYHVTVVPTGEQALEHLESVGLPDLVLLDINLPGIDGFEVCRRIKAHPQWHSLPVIFLTGKDSEASETLGFDMGAVDYITKPIRIPILKARVRTHVDLKRARDLLESLSNLDGLTGIANRRHFDDHYATLWRVAQREGWWVGVMMVDIDHFKAYNDCFGHQEGDACLKLIARTLMGCLHRPLDLTARYGGEEFIAVMTNTAPEDVGHLAETMRQAVQALALPHAPSSTEPHVTISVGVACGIPNPDLPPETLIQRADLALYQVKRTTRNAVQSFDLASQ